jgi:hypothetical protein
MSETVTVNREDFLKILIRIENALAAVRELKAKLKG